MLTALILFAQVADKPEPPFLFSILPLLMIVAAFYFLMILPGRKERQQRQAMMGTLKRNDKVITNGGIIGVVTNIKEGTDEITIKSEDTKLLILRSSIARIVTEAQKDSSSTQIKPTT